MRVILLTLVATSLACVDGSPPRAPSNVQAALAGARQRYVVSLKDDVADPGAVAAAHAATPDFVYTRALRGFAAELAPGQVQALGRDPRVIAVEPDYVGEVGAEITPTGVQRVGAPVNLGLPASTAHIAVLDTGVEIHPDLNVVEQVSCARKKGNWSCARAPHSDGHGHGTHVAGTAAAIDNDSGVVGVAPGAPIHSVQVCDFSGSCDYSRVIAGLDWVTANAAIVDVANLSLSFATAYAGGTCASTSQALQRAVCSAQAAGVVVVVAAGNDAVDATQKIPAGFPEPITVSALHDSDGLDGGDVFAWFSNFGPAIDIMAPGVDIYSTKPFAGYQTMSGTSMAAPHVTGAIARLAEEYPGAGVAQLRALLLQSADVTACATPTGLCDGDPDGIAEPLLAIPVPLPVCQTSADCDAAACATAECVDGGLPTARCVETWLACGAIDGCCAPSCSSGTDTDCPAGAVSSHVHDIAFTQTGSRNRRIQGYVTLRDDLGAPVPNATVTSLVNLGGAVESWTSVSGADGVAKVLDLNTSSSATVRVEVLDVAAGGLVYNAAANVETCRTWSPGTATEGACD